MESGDRFPEWSRNTSSRSRIQIVGPGSGGCLDVIHEVRDYLQRNGYQNTEAVTVRYPRDIADIKKAIGTIFVFLDPDCVSNSTYPSLNRHVIIGYEYWMKSYTESAKNTSLIFQGQSDDLSNELENSVQTPVKLQSHIREQVITRGGLSALKDAVLTCCIGFEWETDP